MTDESCHVRKFTDLTQSGIVIDQSYRPTMFVYKLPNEDFNKTKHIGNDH